MFTQFYPSVYVKIVSLDVFIFSKWITGTPKLGHQEKKNISSLQVFKWQEFEVAKKK